MEKFYNLTREKQLLLSSIPTNNAADFFEYCVDQHGDAPCVAAVDSPTSFTFKQLDAFANQIANWATQYTQPGQVVALMMENCPEYLGFTMGLAKVGVTIALINTNLKGSLLLHALETAMPVLVLAAPNFYPLFKEYSFKVVQTDSVELKDEKRPDPSLRSQLTTRSPLFYIYTSGTTGKSKAAKFSHKRFIGAAATWSHPSTLQKGDAYYICLPLYHGNAGVVAVAPCYLLGCPMVLRKKFSASNFFKDVETWQCKAMIYIGEIWTYLSKLPAIKTSLKVIIGNGLRRELWSLVQVKYGIQHIVEHYGSTEMPGDAILNYFMKEGSCGYLPPQVALEKSMTGEGGCLVEYDIENECVKRNEHGYCIQSNFGEMIMRLPDGVYDGYVGQDQTNRKLYKNVFQQGDVWWSSGDLLSYQDGFYYFVDRIGDTFRWKGENVATKEVEAVLSTFEAFGEVNVYGIRLPGHDGKCGMAAVSLVSEVDWQALTQHVSCLPSYARPLFYRIVQENEKTSTFKLQKHAYSTQALDCPDPIYFHGKLLTKEILQKLPNSRLDRDVTEI